MHCVYTNSLVQFFSFAILLLTLLAKCPDWRYHWGVYTKYQNWIHYAESSNSALATTHACIAYLDSIPTTAISSIELIQVTDKLLHTL